MRVVTTIMFDMEEKFEERKPNIEMFNRFLKSRIHTGSINEGNMRGRVIMNIQNVKITSMEID